MFLTLPLAFEDVSELQASLILQTNAPQVTITSNEIRRALKKKKKKTTNKTATTQRSSSSSSSSSSTSTDESTSTSSTGSSGNSDSTSLPDNVDDVNFYKLFTKAGCLRKAIGNANQDWLLNGVKGPSLIFDDPAGSLSQAQRLMKESDVCFLF
jgi:transcription elongation factor Elf1